MLIIWAGCRRAGSLAVPLRSGQRWHLSSTTAPRPRVPILRGPPSTFTFTYFPVLSPRARDPVSEYLHSCRPPRSSPPAANPATSSSPPPRARSCPAAPAASRSALPLSRGLRHYTPRRPHRGFPVPSSSRPLRAPSPALAS